MYYICKEVKKSFSGAAPFAGIVEHGGREIAGLLEATEDDIEMDGGWYQGVV